MTTTPPNRLAAPRKVFITGGTGYIGRELIPVLLRRGHHVRVLVRPGSEHKLPAGALGVSGDPLDATTFADKVNSEDTFVQLVGVPRPSPAKARQFQEIDLPSVRASVSAAAAAKVANFVYVSVAHPAPIMKAYIAVRSEGERLIRDSGLTATIVRPWYVLGPGHVWPYALLPAYKILELIPSTRDTALRLGLVTLAQMTNALVQAVERTGNGVKVVEVVDIRRASRR
jgi:uncharacterized protein YbjT (DUF2867 family)